MIGFMTSSGPQHLYRWFNSDDLLLYVGISVNAYTRAKHHQKNAEWWPEASKMTLEVYPDRHSVEEAEKKAIRDEKPKYNITYNRDPQERADANRVSRSKTERWIVPGVWEGLGYRDLPIRIESRVEGSEYVIVRVFNPVTLESFQDTAGLEYIYSSKSLKRITGHPSPATFRNEESWKKYISETDFPGSEDLWVYALAEKISSCVSREEPLLEEVLEHLQTALNDGYLSRVQKDKSPWWGRPGLLPWLETFIKEDLTRYQRMS